MTLVLTAAGPLTLPLGTSFTFLSLSSVYEKYQKFATDVTAQNPEKYLISGASSTVVAGFKAQQRVLARLFSSDKAAAYEASINGVCSRALVILRPLSRGTININTTSPSADPLIDMRTYSNPLDLTQATEFIRFTRKWVNAPSLAQLGPVELAPGSNVTTDEDLVKHIRTTSFPTSFHPAGTAAMMPRHLGGVVASDLKVYGVGRLSVVDASIIPLIPASHLSATVYAIGEKV
jgi:choline dehydrogenase-like flavoprotein